MSIQLLPKLFNSFQQFVVTGHGPHWITNWANRQLNMMELFFSNVTQFVESLHKANVTSNSLYSPIEEIQARLQFLSSVFSCELSQQDFSKLHYVLCLCSPRQRVSKLKLSAIRYPPYNFCTSYFFFVIWQNCSYFW